MTFRYETAGEYIELCGTIDHVSIPDLIAIQGRGRSDRSHSFTIRPTSSSGERDIAHYFHVVGGVCQHAMDDLVGSGVLDSADARIAPVDGCFAGRPPEPHVTVSEVIAILLTDAAVSKWSVEGSLSRRLRKIISVVQSASGASRCTRTFRTYVLVYVEGSGDDGRRNRLLAVDFDLDHAPLDVSKEAGERKNLLSDLEAIFSRETVEQALSLAIEICAPDAPNLPSAQTLVSEAMKIDTLAIIILIIGCVSIASLGACVLILSTGLLSIRWESFISISGAMAGVLLMMSGSVAEELSSSS